MMDCERYHEVLEAYADGELDAVAHPDAVRHLDACHACRERVDDLHRMKAALKRTWGLDTAPEPVRRRVVAAIDAVPEPVGSGRSARRDFGAGRAGPSRPDRRMPALIAVGLAAAVVLAVAAWMNRPPSSGPRPTVTMIPSQLVADVRERHNSCVAREHGGHHAADLPRAPRAIATHFGRLMELSVIAPDLSSHGFELIGADSCAIQSGPTCHVLYRSLQSGAYLSVFTTRRLERLRFGPTRRGVRDYLAVADRGLGVLAWNDGPQTYLACGPFSVDELMGMMNTVRTARRDRPGDRRMLAAVRP